MGTDRDGARSGPDAGHVRTGDQCGTQSSVPASVRPSGAGLGRAGRRYGRPSADLKKPKGAVARLGEDTRAALTCSDNCLDSYLTLLSGTSTFVTMRVVGYLRVSTEVQAEGGLGLDVQRHAISTWAKASGHKITLWASDEGVSGSNGLDSRVGLLDAISALQEKSVQGLVVYRLDRLARDLNLQEQLLAEVWRIGGRVFSTSASEDSYLDPEGAADDPSRTMIRQILGAVSEYERAVIRLRLRSGKQRKAAAGGYVGGGVPLGQRVESKELVADAGELVVRDRILELHTEGKSLRSIAAQLDAEGHKPKRSARWHAETIRCVVRAGRL